MVGLGLGLGFRVRVRVRVSSHAMDRLSARLRCRSISSAFELFNKFNTAFVAFDLDGDGTITASELATATRSLGQQARQDEGEG
jgi:hypothetical protein